MCAFPDARITGFPDIKRHIWRSNASVGHWIITLHLGNGNTRLSFLRIPCGRTHFNFLFPHRANLIRNFGSHGRKSRNLIAKYDNKLGQTSTRRLLCRKTHRQIEEMNDRDYRSILVISLETEAFEKSLSSNLQDFDLILIHGDDIWWLSLL